MKKKLQTIAILIISISYLSNIEAQTINYQDNIGSSTLSYNGIVNGKNSYVNSGEGISVSWSISNGRWEIDDGFDNPAFISTYDSTPNPPDLATGNWQSQFGNNLSQFDGSGTQNFLPVELTAFEGKNTEEGNQLIWQTASEYNNEGFEVQRSQYGKAYTALGFVRGRGDANEPHEYSFVDEKPMIGMNYYRLKQLDYDGAFEYSDVRSVKFTDSRLVISVSPNPTQSGTFTLYLPETEATTIEMTLYDYTGRLVRQNQIEQLQTNISVADLEKGIYLIRVDMEDVTAWERLVVQ